MPIDLTKEVVMPLAQATGSVPQLHGRNVSTNTLYRWSTVGLRGVRLETIQIGGTRCTSAQALQRFFERLSSR